jgi:26S proteasome regulatory subunit N7
METGSDWDCRNRLKDYCEPYSVSIRKFKHSVVPSIDAVLTSTATGLFRYDDFVMFTVIPGGWN